MTETLQVRVHGPSDRPTLIYLPGLHGDWTLVGSFRRALDRRVRFVEITYPRTLAWSLEDYAAGIEIALAENGVGRGWVLAESFGSQVAWPLAARGQFEVQGLILAGGFGRHPARWGVWMAERLMGKVTPAVLTRLTRLYARVARLRYRHATEVLGDLDEFCARRTDLDCQAAQHRLKLILQNDPHAFARKMGAPVYALVGLVDPIVPWLPVRRWLRQNCPKLRDHRVIWQADHTVLATAANAAADQVLRWIGAVSSADASSAPEIGLAKTTIG